MRDEDGDRKVPPRKNWQEPSITVCGTYRRRHECIKNLTSDDSRPLGKARETTGHQLVAPAADRRSIAITRRVQSSNQYKGIGVVDPNTS